MGNLFYKIFFIFLLLKVNKIKINKLFIMKKIGDILITILWGAPNILTLYYLFFYNMGNLSYATLIMTI